jgi:DNA-binding protein H-NS
MNILKKANEIVFERSEEKSRQYGDFHEGMEKAAAIFNGMTGMKVTAVEMYKALIALKLSRESFNHKEDNLLDAVAYMASMNEYLENQKS